MALVPHKLFTFLKIYAHEGFRMMSEVLLRRKKTQAFSSHVVTLILLQIGKYSNVFHT